MPDDSMTRIDSGIPYRFALIVVIRGAIRNHGASRVRLIYKLVSTEEWRDFTETGLFVGSAVDRADGFIHFSYADQLPETATKHFRGRDGLVLFACDAARFGVALKDEVSRGGALFPHLFAHLRRDDVLWSRPAPLDEAGIPILGALER
jgi:uncharacterized protein (DUF952 family)